MATVQQAPIDDVEPMSHPMPIVNVTRPDVVRPSLAPAAALSGAPEAEQQRFSVPASSTKTDRVPETTESPM